MSVLTIVEEYAERNKWSERDVIEILCDYLDNQQSNDAVEDHLKHAEEEG